MSQNNYFGTMNTTNLHTVLCELFFGANHDETLDEYIVPLQGNMFSPVNTGDYATWIGYTISSKKTTSSATNTEIADNLYRECIATITLTFIGPGAEDLATSLLFWSSRSDVQSIFDKYYKGQLNHKPITIKSSMYMQEGLNNTLCWSTQLEVTYNESINTSTLRLTKVDGDISGKLIIGGN